MGPIRVASRVYGRSQRGKPQLAVSRVKTILIKPKAGVRPTSHVTSLLTFRFFAIPQHPALSYGKGSGVERIVESFSELFLREDVVSALEEVGATKPTLIQMLAIPKILRGKNVICASETG